MNHVSTSAPNKNSMADMLYTIMLLCKGFNAANRPIWAYICVKPSMAKSFKEARDRGNIDISDYGTVIDSGLGVEPPAEVQQRMVRDYGVNHEQAEELLNKMADVNTDYFH